MTTPTFLYIEDHPASREIMTVLLTTVMRYQHLYTLENTQDLEVAIERFGQAFDVVFLDLNLQPLNGYEACAILRRLESTKAARIIGVTANTAASAQQKMVETGFNGIIGKPISHKSFPALLTRILAGEDIWEMET